MNAPVEKVATDVKVLASDIDELVRASAYRVYEDPADLLRHIDEVGGRR